LLAFEGLSPVQGGLGDGTLAAAIGAGPGFEGLKAATPVVALPLAESRCPYTAAATEGDVIFLAGQSGQETAFLAGGILAAQEGQDEGVAEEGHLGAFLFGIDVVGHG